MEQLQLFDDTSIEEIAFFATNRLEFFIALVWNPEEGLRLAGRMAFRDGSSSLFLSPSGQREELQKVMETTVARTARVYDARYAHLVFKAGISGEDFLAVLRQPGLLSSFPWSPERISEYANPN